MLRHTARRAWRPARPLHDVPASVCTDPKLLRRLALRCSSSSLSEGPTGSADVVENVKKEAKVHQRTAAWEERILPALRTYRHLLRDLLVPRSFVVPAGDERWPSVTWGYKLGNAVRNLRVKIETKSRLPVGMEEELKNLGFVANVSQFKWDNIVLPALWQYRKIHGHADVPQGFVVPSGDEAWPRLAWGHRLGRVVSDIRHRKTFSSQVAASKAELDEIGICYDMLLADRDWKEKILPSFQVYRQEFGNCLIPKVFTVPSSAPWPDKAWTMPLGVVVREIRSGANYVEQVTRDKDVLDAIGFVWNRDDAVWSEVILPALQVYGEVYKTDIVPYRFVVPSEDPWPRKSWETKLGVILSQVRSMGTYFAHYGRDIEKLDELGLYIKLTSRAWNKCVVPLLDIYAELNGEEEVPYDFVIPSEAPWEQKAWGVRLGLIMANNPQFRPRRSSNNASVLTWCT